MSNAVAQRVASRRPDGGPPSRLWLRRGQLVVLGVLLALAAAAWFVTDLRMAGMDAGPGTDPGAFGFYVSTWIVMMAAMMFPSIGPMVLVHHKLQVGRRGDHTPAAANTAVFVAGYLAVWAASGLLAYAALKAGRALEAGLLGWHRGGRWVAVAILASAALYEFTPLKNACLARCRSPLGLLIGSWRDGLGGSIRMGISHGAWCLGCCWLLMLALFALGAMSITWMILITALIAAEKLLPRRVVGTGSAAVVLAALAVGVAVSPRNVPGLTIPGSPTAMRAMTEMRGSLASMGTMGAQVTMQSPATMNSRGAMPSGGAMPSHGAMGRTAR